MTHKQSNNNINKESKDTDRTDRNNDGKTKEVTTKKFSNLQVLYTNADQFLNKMEDLKTFISGDEPDIIIITEVIPKAQANPIDAPLLEIDGYKPHVNFDISKTNLGAFGIRGVAIYVRDDLTVNEIILSSEFKDQLWLEIYLTEQKSLLCGCIYRSPTKEKEATLRSTTQVCDILSKAAERKHTHLLICGDFNYREIHWENKSIDENSGYLSTFVNTIQDCFLYQHVTEPTRYRHGEEPSLLDLILSNGEGMVHNLEYHPGLGDSDHVTLTFDLICYKEHKKELQSKPDFFKADFNAIKQKLVDINWEESCAVPLTKVIVFSLTN